MTINLLLRRCWPFFFYAGIFSLASNILALAPSLYLLTVFDRVLTSRSNETLLALSAIFLFALAVEAIIDRQRTLLLTRLGETFFTQLQDRIFKALLHFRGANNDQRNGLTDLEEIKNFFGGSGLKAAFEIPWIPLYLWVLWLFHPLLSVIAFFSALIMLGMTYVEEVITARNEKEASRWLRNANQFVDEVFRNAEAVMALGMQNQVETRWNSVHGQFLGESAASKWKASAISGASKFVRNTLQLAEMGAAAWLVINVDGVSPGVTVAATIILGKAMSPMLTVLGSWREFIRFRESLRRLNLMLEEDAPAPGLRHPAPKGAVSVERILFFLDRERNILNGIQFELEAGESLGIVGASGSGKTSLARLLGGIYKPSDGVVRLDGVDVFQWSSNGLGAHVGYLPQNQQLFEGTVAENICRMADPYQDPEGVLEAARSAHAHDMILRLPGGYDTPIGSGGGRLSGGQRQLIALARALYGQPRMVILDEPNANLDVQGELLLMETLRQLQDDKVTHIIVSHNPSLLQQVDKLLILEEGRQVAFGERRAVIQYLRDQRSDVLRSLMIGAATSSVAAS